MPKLVPFEVKTLPPKTTKPVHQRLGERGSICESIHTSQMNLYKPKKRISVQNRLGKSWVNPAVKERSRITLHALRTIAEDGSDIVQQSDDATTKLLKAFVDVIKKQELPQLQRAENKYNMKVQKEILAIQVSHSYSRICAWALKLFFVCFDNRDIFQGKQQSFTVPGGFVISSDGPGIGGQFEMPAHATHMSLNQRFA